MRSVGSLESGHQRQLHPFRFLTTFLKQEDDGDDNDDDDDDGDDDDDDDDDAFLPAILTQVKLKIVLLAKNGFGCALSEEEIFF